MPLARSVVVRGCDDGWVQVGIKLIFVLVMLILDRFYIWKMLLCAISHVLVAFSLCKVEWVNWQSAFLHLFENSL